MLHCDKTITVIKCDGESYTKTVIVGVSWFDKHQIKLEGSGIAPVNLVQIRIPAAVCPDVLPATDDVIALGEITAEITKPADLKPYRHVKVMSVGDNRRGGTPHVAVTCQ